jgi:hypothetical protein
MAGSVRRLAVLSACWLCIGSLCRPAEAQDSEPLSVERGVGAEECPDAPALIARVAAIRGRAGVPDGASYQVDFSHTADTFTAVIHSGVNGESQRVLEGHGLSCAALAQATAVTLALLFDSEAETTAPEPPKPEPPPRAPVQNERLLAEPILIDVHQRGPRVDGTLALGGAGLIGVLRPFSPALTGEIGLQVARWRMGIGVLWNPPQALTLGPGQVRESLLSGTARSCVALTRRDVFRFDVCTGLFAGVVTAQAEGFTRNERRLRTWLAIPLELSFARTSSPIGWDVSASALGSLMHQDFSIDNLGAAYEAPRIGGMLSLRAVGLLSL